MSLEKKIGQLLMVAVPGNSMNPEVEAIMEKYGPGGVIFFGYNLGSAETLKKYTGDLQISTMKTSGIPLFVSIDQEGGRVIRIVDGVTQLPGAMATGVCNDPDLTFTHGKILGMQLRNLGVNMNLAPDLDVNNNTDNPVINTRSLGSDPELVAALGTRYIEGLQEGSCIAVGKHFPGHGDTNKDSHLTLPVITYNLERLRKIEFIPFVRAIEKGVECIMTAHIAYPKVMKNNEPATVSRIFLTDILRTEMNFKGIVMTDALEMNAIAKEMDLGDAAVKSFAAGADILLITSYGENIPLIFNALKKAVEEKRVALKRLDESVERIIEMKLRYNIMACKDKAVSQGSVLYTEDNKRMLGEADEVNRKLSQGALFYRGPADLLKPSSGVKRFFIIENGQLSAGLRLRPHDKTFNSLNEFFGAVKREAPREQAIVYYQIFTPDIAALSRLKKHCGKESIKLVLVASGNPFPVIRSGLYDAVLVSFSGTTGSMQALASCLNGEISPKQNVGITLGFPGKR